MTVFDVRGRYPKFASAWDGIHNPGMLNLIIDSNSCSNCLEMLIVIEFSLRS